MLVLGGIGAFTGFWENYIQNSEKNDFDAKIEKIDAEVEEACGRLTNKDDAKRVEAEGGRRKKEIALQYMQDQKDFPRFFHAISRYVRSAVNLNAPSAASELSSVKPTQPTKRS